tara:strand:- start:492 stop:944 length:453 start_codon:yes stop_codon:yes gene_type:complete
MNYKLLIILFFFTLNCNLNKVSNTHGFRFLDTKFDKIVVNKTNKNDVRKIIGPPSSISKFGDVWFYIERKKTNQKLFKLGKKKISKNYILIVNFNSKGIIVEKDLLDLNNMKDVKIAETKTLKKFEQDNFVYNILATLREKINAPTRNKK